jgi:hypothetical protein
MRWTGNVHSEYAFDLGHGTALDPAAEQRVSEQRKYWFCICM